MSDTQETENPLSKDFDIKSLLMFAFPTIVMMLFMGLYTIVDTMPVRLWIGIIKQPVSRIQENFMMNGVNNRKGKLRFAKMKIYSFTKTYRQQKPPLLNYKGAAKRDAGKA